jgi:hypothetical protein
VKLKHSGLEKYSSKPTPLLKRPSQKHKVPLEVQRLLVDSLNQAWGEAGIPEHFQQSFMSHLEVLSPKRAAKVMAAEAKDLRANRALIQEVLKTIDLREKSLGQLQEMEKYLDSISSEEQLQDISVNCAEMLHSHRMLTLQTVERIVEWRAYVADRFYSASPQSHERAMRLAFMLDNENYLLKIRNDNEFMRTSAYTKMFLISNLVDPFLLQMVKPVYTHQLTTKVTPSKSKRHLVVIELPTTIFQRIRLAEHVLLKETMLHKHSSLPRSTRHLSTNVSLEQSTNGGQRSSYRQRRAGDTSLKKRQIEDELIADVQSGPVEEMLYELPMHSGEVVPREPNEEISVELSVHAKEIPPVQSTVQVPSRQAPPTKRTPVKKAIEALSRHGTPMMPAQARQIISPVETSPKQAAKLKAKAHQPVSTGEDKAKQPAIKELPKARHEPRPRQATPRKYTPAKQPVPKVEVPAKLITQELTPKSSTRIEQTKPPTPTKRIPARKVPEDEMKSSYKGTSQLPDRAASSPQAPSDSIRVVEESPPMPLKSELVRAKIPREDNSFREHEPDVVKAPSHAYSFSNLQSVKAKSSSKTDSVSSIHPAPDDVNAASQADKLSALQSELPEAKTLRHIDSSSALLSEPAKAPNYTDSFTVLQPEYPEAKAPAEAESFIPIQPEPSVVKAPSPQSISLNTLQPNSTEVNSQADAFNVPHSAKTQSEAESPRTSQELMEELTHSIIEALTSEQVYEAASSLLAQEHAVSIHINAILLEDLIASESSTTAKKALQEAFDLREVQCNLEQIIETLVDEMCASTAAKAYAVELAAHQLRKVEASRRQTSKLAEMVFEALLSDLLESSWLTSLAETVRIERATFERLLTLRTSAEEKLVQLEVPEDLRAAFTPVIHSPNAYSMASRSDLGLYTDRQLTSFDESTGYDWPFAFAPDVLAFTVQEVQLVPVVVNESAAKLFEPTNEAALDPVKHPAVDSVLSAYYLRLPTDLESVVQSPLTLLQLIYSSCDPSLHWVVAKNFIVGLLVCSLDPYHEEQLNILHISAIDSTTYSSVVTAASAWAWGASSSIQMCIKNCSGKEDRPDLKVKAKLTELGFECDTAADSSQDIQMKLQKPEGAPSRKVNRGGLNFAFQTTVDCARVEAELLDEPEELATIGSRSNVVAGLIAVSDECTPCPEPFKMRMQADMVELFEIACATGKATYSGVQVTTQDKPDSLKTVTTSSSSLKFLSSLSTTHDIDGVKLSYFQINAVTPRQCSVKSFYNSVRLYTFSTSLPHISAFIVTYPEVKSELRRSRTTTRFDLFAKVEDLTQEETHEDKAGTVMFPCFALSKTQSLNWLAGLSLTRQGEPWVVSSVVDQLEVTCMNSGLGSLVPRKAKCDVIEEEFVFGIVHLGLIHSDLQQDINIPWAAWVVSPSSFLQVSPK